MKAYSRRAADWWHTLPDSDKDRYMVGKTWPKSIPERFALMEKFYGMAHGV